MAKTKLPRDANQRAKRIIDIVTGDDPVKENEDLRNPAAVSLGSMGGKARAANLSAKKRSAIAKKAATKRWGTKRKV